MTNEVFCCELGQGASPGCSHALGREGGHIAPQYQTWEMKMESLPGLGFVCHLLPNKLKGPILFLFLVK